MRITKKLLELHQALFLTPPNKIEASTNTQIKYYTEHFVELNKFCSAVKKLARGLKKTLPPTARPVRSPSLIYKKFQNEAMRMRFDRLPQLNLHEQPLVLLSMGRPLLDLQAAMKRDPEVLMDFYHKLRNQPTKAKRLKIQIAELTEQELRRLLKVGRNLNTKEARNLLDIYKKMGNHPTKVKHLEIQLAEQAEQEVRRSLKARGGQHIGEASHQLVTIFQTYQQYGLRRQMSRTISRILEIKPFHYDTIKMLRSEFGENKRLMESLTAHLSTQHLHANTNQIPERLQLIRKLRYGVR